jgi:hypothetical protein
MPGASRIRDLFGYTSPLRLDASLLPGHYGSAAGWPTWHANAQWGGYLTAVADTIYARVRVDLSWPGVRYATITRTHADGTTYQVRGGDPATMATAWARWDYECPLDQAVTYTAASIDATGATTSTDPVTLASSGQMWLKHVAKPYLNMRVTVKDRGERELPDRRGVLRPPTRPDAIFVNQIRGSDAGSIAIYCADLATETALRSLLADGGPVLLQYPATKGGESLWLSVGRSPIQPATRIMTDLMKSVTLPFESIGRPPGAALGDPDSTYAKQATAYQTYGQQSAAADSYLELSMKSF